jgi:ubiquinone/menaquinone biosynthesis C-methylase UbiE/uncharacterized protein YbaR (Trm112 family)
MNWKTRLFAALRCPDCSAVDLRADEDSGTTQHRTGRIECQGCGRVLELRDGILLALPRTMRSEELENLAYYDQMSAAEQNILARRATSRNHRIKMSTIQRALGLAEGPPKSVLEVGTGYGAHGCSIQERHTYVGLDISGGLLCQARERFPILRQSQLVVADATRTPFQTQFFDAVFCVATLHHLPEPAAGVREMMRLLVEGGRFCFLEPKRFYPTQLIQYLRHPKTEVSAMQMTANRVKKWAVDHGAREATVSYCVFTPNGPRWLNHLYNLVDSLLYEISFFHPLSVMFCVHGAK